MGDLGERVRLVHELGQLRAAEELAHRGRGRLGVDEVMRHHRVDIDRAHALTDGALHAQQAEAILVLHQLAHRAHAAIAEIVDVIDLTATILQLAHDLDGAQHIFLTQGAHGVLGLQTKAHVHLDAADGGEVVTISIEEQAAEQRLGGLRRRRLARAHHTIDIDQRIVTVGVLIHGQSVADPRAVGLIHRERRQLGDAKLLKGGKPCLGQFLAGLGIDLAGVLVHQIDRHVAAEQIGAANQHFAGLLSDAAGGTRGQLCLRVSHDLAGLRVHQRLKQLDAAEGLGVERPRPALGRAGEHHLAIEIGEDLLGIHAANLVQLQRLALGEAGGAEHLGVGRVERVQQRGDRQLALAVNTDIDEVLAVELEIKPRAAIRDHAGGKQIFARAMGFALVVIEEHARAAMHLRDDDALGAIDDEGAVIRHQGHVAHIDGLLLDVADRAGAGVFIKVPDDETEDDLQGRGEVQPALDAFLNIVFRVFQLVMDEFEAPAPGEIVNREDALEHFLQARVAAAVMRGGHLQERLVAGALHVDQVWHPCHFGDTPEALADTLLASEGPSDRVHA